VVGRDTIFRCPLQPDGRIQRQQRSRSLLSLAVVLVLVSLVMNYIVVELILFLLVVNYIMDLMICV
jgi:hypothetical protein